MKQEKLNPPPCKKCGFYPCECPTDAQVKLALENLEKEALELEGRDRDKAQDALKDLWVIFSKVWDKQKS